jgi:hypothetical protein
LRALRDRSILPPRRLRDRMRRISIALLAAGALVAGFAMPASAGAAFGPVGSFGAGNLSHPQAAVVSGSQTFVADTGNGQVAIFNQDGTVTHFGGPGVVPRDVAVQPGTGTIYAASAGQVDAWGLLGIPVAQWFPPGASYGVGVDSSGNVWVGDAQNGVIRSYNANGTTLNTTIGAGELSQPQGLTVDAAGFIYVADTGNARIVKFSPTGTVAGTWPMPSYTINANGQTITGQLQPRDVSVDAAGRVFVPDAGTSSNLVAVFGADGSLQQAFGAPISDPNGPCPVRSPWGVAISPSGALLVVSTGENLIRVFDEASPPCPTPDFGPGGGVTPGPGGGGGGGPTGPDTKKPKVRLRGVPKKCPKGNFAFQIRASDDVLISRLTLFINHKRVARQTPDRQQWNVKVNIPVKKIRRQIPRGAFVRVLIQVKVVDGSGKKATVSKSFRICG